ncbi:MAG: LacI family DNA-binding transcriptional regulator [Armatimonadota bacterium]
MLTTAMPAPERYTSVSMKDIAERCGVNPSTVQRALTGHPKISEATALRIRNVAAELGYNPARNHAARRMVSRWLGKRVINNVIAVFFIPDLANIPYFYRIFLGITGMAAELGYDMLTVQFDPNTSTRSLPHSIVRGEVDGAIFCYPNLASQMVRRIRTEQQDDAWPVVSLIHEAEGCSMVLTDDAIGAYQAVRHLLELGHRHLLHFYSPEHTEHLARLRVAGYQRAFLDFGLDPRQHLHLVDPEIINVSIEIETERYLACLLAQLARQPQITGILAQNDYYASFLTDGLLQAGYRIPEDMSLVGFDDTNQMRNERGELFLTTVHVPLEEIGREAVRYLVDRINGRISMNRQILLPTFFVDRASTGPPRS